MTDKTTVRIVRWNEDDLPLLEKLMGDPVMTEHIGGPETPEKVADRHQRYVAMTDPAAGQMFKIVDVATGDAVGSVGYWERTEQDEPVYETGWSVLPQFQGRGIAGMATAELIVETRAQKKHRYLYAYPSITNPPSNAICRKLGFTLVEEREFEYPLGSFMRCNVWRLDLLGA